MNDYMILDGTRLAIPSFDQYSCWEEDLDVQTEMASGLVVIDTKGKVWRMSYVSDYLEDNELRPVLATLLSGRPFLATMPPNNSDELITSTFIKTSITRPALMGFDGGKPIWHGLAFELREERPRRTLT